MLTVSTGSRYALRALLELSARNSESPVSIQTLADSQNISPKYLESIFNHLRKSGIVRSYKGPKGGYRLLKLPGRITLFEIMNAIDGPLQTVACVQEPSACKRADTCVARTVWCDLMDHMIGYLKSKTLAQVLTHR